MAQADIPLLINPGTDGALALAVLHVLLRDGHADYLDDLIIVPLGIVMAVWLVPPELMVKHREAAEQAASMPISRAGAVAIACLWIASALVLAWMALGYIASAQ